MTRKLVRFASDGNPPVNCASLHTRKLQSHRKRFFDRWLRHIRLAFVECPDNSKCLSFSRSGTVIVEGALENEQEYKQVPKRIR